MVTMLVTRPEPDASETATRLAALDIVPVKVPLLAQRTLPASLPEARGFAALALTSAAALRALDERGALAAYRGLRTFAVGEKTAATARRLGFADVSAAGGSLADLAEKLAHARLSGPVFYPTARDQAGDLAKSLAPFGVMVITTHVYAMEAAQTLDEAVIDRLAAGDIAAALFYSRRTAETFVRLAGSRLGRPVRMRLGMLCLSEAIAEPLIENHFVRISLAEAASEAAMMRLALSFAREQDAS